jgi:peroxiredoxin
MGINTAEHGDARARAGQFQAKHGLTYPILLDVDGRVRSAYGVRAFPTNVIVDRSGTVRYASPGFNQTAIDAELARLMR